MNGKKVSMKQIAEALDISIVSVSKAINNQSGISEELRKRILDTAYELGYIAQKRENNVQVSKFAYVTPKRFIFEAELFYTQIFYHLNEKCIENGISLTLFVVTPENESQLSIPALLNSSAFDGMFISGEMSDPYIFALRNLDIPALCIDFYKPDMPLDCVVFDNFFAGYHATAHLIQNGHRQIGFVTHPSLGTSIADRMFGYSKALFQYSLENRPEWNLVFTDGLTLPETLPTAFVCHNDVTAQEFMKLLEAAGKKVPEDVSIISFDNLETSQVCNPPLTTVDINREICAQKAFEQMLNRINNYEEEYQRIIIDSTMVLRDSVKKLEDSELRKLY